MNKRYLVVGVLTLVLAFGALGFMTMSARAATNAAPPDPEWELARERAMARLAKLDQKMSLIFDQGYSQRKLEMKLLDFARAHGLKVRHSDRFYEMRQRRFNNGYTINRRYNGTQGTGQGTQQGTGQGTTQGTGQGTTQGTGQGTTQGTGQGTTQGTGQGTYQGAGGVVIGANLVGNGRDHAPLRLGGRRCSSFAKGSSFLTDLAKRNGVSTDEVAGRLCGGRQIGDIRLGYWISRKAGVSADSVFADRASGKSWNAILDSYDLKFDNWR